MKQILVTGGLGFIGSHTVVSLLEAGYEPIIFDNLSNSFVDTLDSIAQITGKKPVFVEGDIRNAKDIDAVFANNKIDAVMHFAALKSVGESCAKPDLYYSNNVGGMQLLLDCMYTRGVQKIIFSGSATVYGDAPSPIDESTPVGAVTNPYGRTKVINEYMLQDYAQFLDIQAISLRYFNPIGAHPSGLLGERVVGIPNNIFPYILKVLSGELESLTVFGDDYPTNDGTGVRDYIDIMDLVDGHIAALDHIKVWDTAGFDAINLGTGKGTSVLELIETTARIAGKDIAYRIGDRRPGDIAEVYAAVDKAKEVLGREATYNIEDSVRNALRFVGRNT